MVQFPWMGLAWTAHFWFNNAALYAAQDDSGCTLISTSWEAVPRGMGLGA